MERISDYDYPLPPDAIAQEPIPRRDASRLMILDLPSGRILHRTFHEITGYIRTGDVLVLNDTQVIPARFFGFRGTGGRVEIFLLERIAPFTWEAMTRPTARLKEGEAVTLQGKGTVRLAAYLGGGRWRVSFEGFSREEEVFQCGRMPLPPYIKRMPEGDPRDPLDRERYQTVYGRRAGAVAAPTAGLHFTPKLLGRIAEAGVRLVWVTLHVGAGTFTPIREEDITRHRMHSERFSFPPEAARALNRVRIEGGRIVAVGTTSARVLETVIREDGTFVPVSGRTDLYIYPPYRFRAVDLLVTNFHLPRSSLLLLVAAFAGREKILAAYREAAAAGYRFYSYGDAMLLGDVLEDRCRPGGRKGEEA